MFLPTIQHEKEEKHKFNISFQIFLLSILPKFLPDLVLSQLFFHRWINFKNKNKTFVGFFSCFEMLHSFFHVLHVSLWLYKLFIPRWVCVFFGVFYIYCIQTCFIVNKVAFHILMWTFFLFIFVKWRRWLKHFSS